MAHDREVAGIRCMQVLDALPDFVDGELEAKQRDRIQAHLEGCDWCESFGGRYGNVVRQLRHAGRQQDEQLAAAAERLAAGFEEEA